MVHPGADGQSDERTFNNLYVVNMAPSFEELPWYDAELRALSIDRSEPGIADRVDLSILWPHGAENEIRFSDCYALVAEMNFGVIARETILAARINQDASALATVKARWAPTGVLLDDLTCFEIETAATGSTLRMLRQAFRSPPAPFTQNLATTVHTAYTPPHV